MRIIGKPAEALYKAIAAHMETWLGIETGESISGESYKLGYAAGFTAGATAYPGHLREGV